MKKFRNKYRIESNRLKGWDYSKPGSYFITICIVNRECILGKVHNGNMVLSEYGKVVESEIQKIPEYHKRALLDAWVVMPNHIHCIISLGNYGFENGIARDSDENVGCGGDGDCGADVEKIHEFSLHRPINEIKQYRKSRRKMIIPKILGKLQMQTSRQINILRNTPGRKNWQHDYYDRIIRDEAARQCIKYYIINNPKKWHKDMFYKK